MGGRISEFGEIVGRSEEMRSAERMICKVAASDATVLITGESGTGKELMARAVHLCSPRKERQFVPVDCGALCAQIMESELFGHVRGAFTGAL
ncbi:sigma 54-interacting transcriptional regulator, partial [bacterium]|nr:sigma 54-interacting transcriptional regulator [bacterium]